MCSLTGDCFVVLPPNTNAEVIFGRNSVDSEQLGVSQEVFLYDASTAVEGVSDGGAEPDVAGDTFRVILQKPWQGVWGGECGANESNVSVGVTWTSQDAEIGSGNLNATDIVRYALATSSTAAAAVDRIGSLVAAYAAEVAKLSFVVCDAVEAWAISSGGKLWAAQRITEGFVRFPSCGLAVTTIIDKSSDALADALQTLELWNGEGELNFAACFDAFIADTAWSGDKPAGDGKYSLINMFDTLRSAAEIGSARSSTISVLTPATQISCHWFTATPNPIESVFKPFVFAPNAKISPLTSVPEDQTITLLHKLHGLRKPTAVIDLKTLEASCVDEVNKYLSEHPSADEELDELMKDCVEAEVKFYR